MILLDIFTRPEYGFLRMVFLLSSVASITFGLIGTFVVARRIGYLAGAVSHCAFGGVGIGLWLKQAVAAGGLVSSCFSFLGTTPSLRASHIDPVAVAVVTAVFSALLLGILKKYTEDREDALIGILWSLGMAIGLLFLSRTTGYKSVNAWLFGDINLVSMRDLVTVLLLGGGVCLTILVFFKRLEAVCFDPEFAQLRGLHIDFYHRLLLTLVAITVVLMIRIVGLVLVIALLTIPPSAASRLTSRLAPMIFGSILVCLLGSWIGIILAVLLNFPAGPMIIVVIALLYFATVAFTRKR